MGLKDGWQHGSEFQYQSEKAAVTRIRTGVAAATTQSTNHYTITARYHSANVGAACGASEYQAASSSLDCRKKPFVLPT